MPPGEFWVDAYASEGGDGTATSPFKHLTSALLLPAVVHLAPGLYEGPFQLPAGTVLRGPKEAVLFGSAEAAAVVLAETAALEGVAIQGGQVGLQVGADVRLDKVSFSGQRRTSVHVLAGASLMAKSSLFDGTVTETVGVHLEPNSMAFFETSRFTGGYRRAIDVAQARVLIDRTQIQGPVEAIRVEKGEATLRSVDIGGGRGPAIAVSQSQLFMRTVHVTGHEYGLLVGHSTVSVEDFSSQRAQKAGVSTTECKGALKELDVREAGSYGALQLSQSELHVEQVTVRLAISAAVTVRQGTVTLRDVDVQCISEEGVGDSASGGDGVHVRDATVTVERLRVDEAQGAGLWATAFANVTVSDFDCQGCRAAAVLAERGAKVKVKGLNVRESQGAALVVPDAASIDVDGLTVSSKAEPVWAECDQGAKVTVAGWQGAKAQGLPACVKVK